MPRNILVFAPDDFGREYLRCYAKLPLSLQIQTPNIQRLAQSGVLFARGYSEPWCSPTRATWLAGRYANQTGIGSLAEGTNQPLLSTEVCLPSAIKTATSNAYITSGWVKWHLSDWASVGGAYEHPIRTGFDHWEGHLRNLDGGETYDSFEAFTADPAEDGDGVTVSKYQVNEWAPKYFADRCSAWIRAQTKPWLTYFAVNLPHTPFNRPPSYAYDTAKYNLPNYAPPAVNDASCPIYSKAMVQGLDWTLGYLLRSIPQATLANTTIIFWADNGTQSEAFDTLAKTGIDLTPYLGAGYAGKAKRTVYELGCNVPMIVAGAGVTNPGRTSQSLVSSADLFKTVIELVGGDYSLVPLPVGGTRPSISFAQDLLASTPSARTMLPLDLFGPNGPNVNCTTNGSRALVYTQYKLLKQNGTGVTGFPAGTAGVPVAGVEFYDLLADPNETVNLVGTNPINLTGATLAAYSLAVSDFTTAFSLS